MKVVAVLAVLCAVVFGALALVKLVGRIRRRSGAARLRGQQLQRQSHGVDLDVLLYRTRPWHGMLPGRPHAARADLLLTPTRVVLASDRGVLVDVDVEQAHRRLRSVRCTGPARLVLEGEVPDPGMPGGLFRLELVIPEAAAWAEALRPFSHEVVGWQPGERPRRPHPSAPAAS